MTERERVARAMVAASRPTADPDALTPAPRGMVGMVPIWQTFGHLADAALSAMSPAWRPIPAEVREGEEPWRRILDTSLRMYPGRGFRVGMRSGMMDAATVCDFLAKRILATKRPTKFQREAAALLTGCGDEIMRMRDEVTVPLDDAPIPPLPAPPSAEEG